jgi:hypothetical protein
MSRQNSKMKCRPTGMTSVGGEKRHSDCGVNVVRCGNVHLGANTPNDQKFHWPSPYPLQVIPVALSRHVVGFASFGSSRGSPIPLRSCDSEKIRHATLIHMIRRFCTPLMWSNDPRFLLIGSGAEAYTCIPTSDNASDGNGWARYVQFGVIQIDGEGPKAGKW